MKNESINSENKNDDRPEKDNKDDSINFKSPLGILTICVILGVLLYLMFGNPQSSKYVYLFQTIVYPGKKPSLPRNYTGKWLKWSRNGTKEGEYYYKNGKLIDWTKGSRVSGYVYFDRGLDYLNSDKFSEAAEDFLAAIASGQLNRTYLPYAYYNLGVAYYRSKNLIKALNNYNKAIQLNANFAIAYNNRGLIFDDRGNIDKALADYNRTLALNNDSQASLYAYNNRGYTTYKLKKYQEAIADYNKALKLDPRHAPTYNNRGLAYFEMNEIKKAKEDFFKALDLNNDPQANVFAYDKLGLMEFKKGNLTKALDYYNNALNIKPEDDEILRQSGLINFYLIDYKSAIDNLRKSLKLNPKNKMAALWLFLAEWQGSKNKNDKILMNSLKQDNQNNKWLVPLIKFFLNKIPEDLCLKKVAELSLPQNKKMNITRCHYYQGMYYKLTGNKKKALSCFDKCLNNSMPYIYESIAAKNELKQKKR